MKNIIPKAAIIFIILFVFTVYSDKEEEEEAPKNINSALYSQVH